MRHLSRPEWGLGLILSLRGGNKLDVYFEFSPSKAPVTLLTESAFLRVVRAKPTSALLDLKAGMEKRASRKAKPGRKILPLQELTHAKAVSRFRKQFPKGFKDKRYLAQERDYKVAAHDSFCTWLSRPRRMKLLRDGAVADLSERLLYIEGRTNLISPFEKARLRDSLKDQRAAFRFFGALFALIDAKGINEGLFNSYLLSLEALPAKRGRVATWPVATIIPFLARPDRHTFVKPMVTQAAARSVGIDLAYDSRPTWTTYKAALDLAAELKRRLAPLGCRDMIDVQSFVWLAR